MVPLLVVLTILSFVVVDVCVQKVAVWKATKKPIKLFNPATDVMWNGGLPSMADGGEPIEDEKEKK